MKRVLLGILTTLAVACVVCAQQTGEWSVLSNDGILIASTLNDSGRLLGQFCSVDSGNCIWMMSMSTACVQDRFYPILANGNKSALHLTIKCTGRIEGGQFGYVFTEFDKIDEFVKESPRMAFAMPLDGDEFNVVRFTGKGAEEAISRMRSTAERSSKNPIRNTGTRDRKL